MEHLHSFEPKQQIKKKLTYIYNLDMRDIWCERNNKQTNGKNEGTKKIKNMMETIMKEHIYSECKKTRLEVE